MKTLGIIFFALGVVVLVVAINYTGDLKSVVTDTNGDILNRIMTLFGGILIWCVAAYLIGHGAAVFAISVIKNKLK